MSNRLKCPYCGSDKVEAWGGSEEKPGLWSEACQCRDCDEYFTAYYKTQFIGYSSYGCNLFPAEGVTEALMRAYGVDLDD